MRQSTRQEPDGQLWQMLDTPTAWLVCTEAGLLRPQRTLREALWQAWSTSADGGSVSSIVKIPDADTVIELPQMRRLTTRLARTE